MTSLSNQLEVLRTATARHLTVEKRHVSLIFDRKEAGQLDNETALRIGVAGLEQMKRIDQIFDTEKINVLFEETKLGFVRSMLSKEENASLDNKIEKLLFELAPYLQHFACQQVLEYLVHTYEIYAYNAETLIITFLPFHDTKIYARVLAILDFDFARSKEWAFMEVFKKKEIPIPFSAIVKATMAGTHSIVTRLSDHIKKGVEIVGNDYLETRSPVLFNFYAKLLLSLFQDPEKVDEALLAKLMVFIVAGIKSPMLSFRQISFMVICQLVLTVKLKDDVLKSISKLLIMKIRQDSAFSTLSTLAVITQQQELTEFSTRAFQKMLKHEDNLHLSKHVKELAKATDLLKFYKPFWSKLIELMKEEGEEAEVAKTLLNETANATVLSRAQAELFLSLLQESGQLLDEKASKSAVYSIASRFADVLDELHTAWTAKDAEAAKTFMTHYDLESLLIVKTSEGPSPSKRTRRRTNSMRKSIGDEPVKPKKSAAEKAQELADASEFAKRRVFQGDPLFKAKEFLDAGKWDKLTWALEEITARPATYLKGKPDDDVEELVVDLVALSVKQPKVVSQAILRSAVANAKLNDNFSSELLTKQDSTEKSAKKARGPKGAVQSPVKKAFAEETDEEFEKRLTFVLNVLHMKQDVHAGPLIIKTLFEIVKGVNAKNGDASSFLHQQLAINVLIKLFDAPAQTYKISQTDLDMDCVVEAMRSTQSHHLLRDCLRLLTSTVKHSPADVVKHIMSIFTFMGNGLLRKDNEMTLSIVEKTVESLFKAIVEAADLKGTTAQVKERETLKLVEVARLFASSAADIPAHRRARVAQAIGRSVRAENAATITMVLLAGFCARWQRINDSAQKEAAKKGTDQEAYDDFAISLLASLDPFEQLSAVLDMVSYILRLGGDQGPSDPKKKPSAVDVAVFDRSSATLPKLRHFRFVVVSLIAKVFASKTLIEKLAAYSDDELLARALPQGKRLMEYSVELDDFATAETEKISEADAQTQRYWVAFASRAEVVSEKLRHLLPGGVAARLIAQVLAEKTSSYKLREKALQLANIKLGHTGHFFTDSGINERELVVLASVLNQFINAETKDANKMLLCQNAAYTLKLIAKHLPLQSESTVLAETMAKCVETASKYQKLDENLTGNILLLAGELIRSHNMRSTMHHAISLLKICVVILKECVTKFTAKSLESSRTGTAHPDERKNRGQRIRQISLGGLRLGSDTLLICSLTCTQRIFDQYATFVAEHVGDVVVAYCKLSGRFGNAEMESLNTSMQQLALPFASGSQASGNVNRSSVQHRLALIKRALLTIELRVVPQHFAKAVSDMSGDQKAIGALFSLLSGYFEPANRATVSKTCKSLVEQIFLPALNYRSTQRHLELFESATKVEKSVFDAIISMANILSEHEFRPVVNLVVGWAEAALTPSAPPSTRLRLLVLFHFANSLYDAFHALALPYFVRILEIVNKVLVGCNATTIEDAGKLLLSGKRKTLESLETDLVLTLAIDVVANSARHKEFFSPDRCAAVSDALVDELVNTKVEGHEERCTKHLVFALYRIADADPDSFADLLNKILLKTRDNRPKIRYRTLLVIEILLERIGDSIQPHLSLLVPFLNELIEDENKQVEEQCQQVVNVLQHKFGDKFWQGSSFV